MPPIKQIVVAVEVVGVSPPRPSSFLPPTRKYRCRDRDPPLPPPVGPAIRGARHTHEPRQGFFVSSSGLPLPHPLRFYVRYVTKESSFFPAIVYSPCYTCTRPPPPPSGVAAERTGIYTLSVCNVLVSPPPTPHREKQRERSGNATAAKAKKQPSPTCTIGFSACPVRAPPPPSKKLLSLLLSLSLAPYIPPLSTYCFYYIALLLRM